MRTMFLEPRKLCKLGEKFSTPASPLNTFAVIFYLSAFLFAKLHSAPYTLAEECNRYKRFVIYSDTNRKNTT
jgi:hypothetical protein